MSREKYRILHVFGNMDRGGAESRIMDIYRNIDREYIQFDFLVMTDHEHYFDKEIKQLGGEIYRVRNPRDSLIGHILDVFKVTRNKNYFQAIHAHTSYHSGLVLLISKISGIKIRIAHARTTSSKNVNSILKKLMIFIGRKLIFFSATDLIAISDEAASFLFGDKVDNEKKIQIIPNSIDLMPYSKQTKIHRKKINNFSSETIIIGQIGRLNFMKNHKFSMKLVEHMKKNKHRIKLIIIGDGVLREELEQIAQEKKILNEVEFLGVRDDVPQLLGGIDVLLMPSLFEGLGGAVLEAQASGIPSIVSDSLPKEVDMGLDLVNFISLSAPLEEWESLVVRESRKERMDFSTIYQAFDKNGYTLKKSTEMLIEIYKISYK